MSTVSQQLMTVEEFRALPANSMQRALVRGELVETMPPGGQHGLLALRLGARLQQWADTGNYGIVTVESGFVLGRNPDTVRGPDISFVAAARIPPGGVPEAFWEQAPDLAVEIVSPSETAAEVRDKVRDFLAAGTALIWVVYPRSREVFVHRSLDRIEVLSGEDVLEDAQVLPGFRCSIVELFGLPG